MNDPDMINPGTDSQRESADVDNSIAGVRALFQQLVDAWNRADGAAYGEIFTADADYTDVTGTHTRGGPAIGQLHQFLFNGPLKGSRLEYSTSRANGDPDLDIRFLSPHIVLVI